MKRIRILTGAHAGAQIPLHAGTYRIGADEDCDICVSDWGDASLTLEIAGSGETHTRDAAQESAAATALRDFMPLSSGAAAVCVGPDDADWPSDLDLLSGMLARDVAGAGRERARLPLKSVGIVLASMMVASALVAGAIMFGTQNSEAISPLPNTNALAARLAGSLDEAGLRELSVAPAGNTVVVRGMVPTAGDDITARRIIDRVGGEPVRRNYDVAADDARNIEESLGMQGTHVAYLGGGVFRITGTVDSLTRFHQALADVQRDFDTNVKRIEPDVRENPVPAASTDYTEMVAIGDVRYIETPDGVKHVYPVTHLLPN